MLIRKITFAALLLLLFPLIQAYSQDNSFIIMSYNVENLFDTIDAPGFDDTEFTPSGSKQWNTEKYNKKLNDLSKVISSAENEKLPDVVGLVEVENRKVLEDLISIPALKSGAYGIVHEESQDKRGIEVALIYRKTRFKYEGHVKIPVAFPYDSTDRTRDILYVYGKAPDGIQIHFFVNHWTSRTGGEKETENKRMYCAVALRRSIDLLLSRDTKARIVIMGDFNDEPTNRSIMNVLQASDKRKNISAGEFYNLMYDKHNLGNEGSYFYSGNWKMLDQIIVSHTLLNVKSGLKCNYDSGKVLREEWMLSGENGGNPLPKRTYDGDVYLGGISDHLPVYVVLDAAK
jgi:predicted extracellular nuclease